MNLAAPPGGRNAGPGYQNAGADNNFGARLPRAPLELSCRSGVAGYRGADRTGPGGIDGAMNPRAKSDRYSSTGMSRPPIFAMISE